MHFVEKWLLEIKRPTMTSIHASGGCILALMPHLFVQDESIFVQDTSV